MQQKKNIYIKLGILILLIALFSIFMFRSCKRARAEEITEVVDNSVVNLYSGNTLIDSEPLTPLIDIYTGKYRDLGKTLILANNLENNNQLYTIEVIFQVDGPSLGYQTGNFNWIASFREIPSVSNIITLYYESGSGAEASVSWNPVDYYSGNNNTRTILIQKHVYVSGSTAEFSTPIIKLEFNINPGTNFYLTFEDTSYSTYSLGYENGYNEGYENGKLAIDSVSYQNGYNTGWDKGRAGGERYGYERGYNVGYQEGYNEGYEQLIQDEQITPTVNFNQLLNYENINTTTYNGITYTNLNNGSWRVNGTASSTSYLQVMINLYTHAGEVYLLKGCPPGGGSLNGYTLWDNINGVFDNGNGVIYRATTNGYIYIRVASGTRVDNLIFTPQLFNLTQIYGAGNEPTTVEQFESDFPSEYYPFTTSDVINLQYMDGFNTGYLEGEYNGIIEGETHVIEQTNFIETIFNSIDAFLNIRLLPHVTIGIIVFIPLMISMAWFVIKAFRGGGE